MDMQNVHNDSNSSALKRKEEDGGSHFDSISPILSSYLDQEQIKLIYQAYLIAEKAHAGQLRRSGDPYITHPVAVAEILANMRMDPESIMAALMHDVLEDSAITKEFIKKKFGDSVAELVDGVSKLKQIEFESRAQAQAENFRKMLLAMVRDIRVILVKLADRLHNMRTLGNMPPKKRYRIARETLDIYAPIANRLGMYAFRIEFEDLGFANLYPWRYRILMKAIKKARGNRKEIVSLIKKSLRKVLDDQGLKYISVLGRQKHIFSIYKKMKSKRDSFSEIMDMYAFRIIVEDVGMCYRALGAVHSIFKPLSERFKDYIAIPKANGYQSLHTTLFGPYGVPIEIQIRTETMDHVAENGIAAHWLYKSPDTAVDDAQIKAREWLKGLLELQQNTGSSLEFIENVKIDLFPEEVYVFTPKGDILELPRGATPVDFAYAIHSDIGNTCVAAKVERRLAPLSTLLSNGQTVEIIAAPGARPNPAWLNFVVTGKAKSGIRHFLKNQQRIESIELGKQLLQNALEQFKISIEKIEPHFLEKLLESLNYKTLDDLYEAIGIGDQVSLIIAKRLIEKDVPLPVEEYVDAGEHPLVIKGTEGMIITYADCCKPIPGDPIVGCLCKGRGIEVHAEDCKQTNNFRNKPDRFITMRWADNDNIKSEFKTNIRIKVVNQRWVLAQIASAIAEADANIDNIFVDQSDGQHVIMKLTIAVQNRAHLEHVMQRLRSVKAIDSVVRDK